MAVLEAWRWGLKEVIQLIPKKNIFYFLRVKKSHFLSFKVRPGTGVTPSDQLMKIFQAGLKQVEIDEGSNEKNKLHTADDGDGLDLGKLVFLNGPLQCSFFSTGRTLLCHLWLPKLLVFFSFNRLAGNQFLKSPEANKEKFQICFCNIQIYLKSCSLHVKVNF